jgi:hypothetical protein
MARVSSCASRPDDAGQDRSRNWAGLAAGRGAAPRLTGPAGLIFLTGPTGSGKTTTLHSALHALDHRGRAIHTLEDPVEYEFPASGRRRFGKRSG